MKDTYNVMSVWKKVKPVIITGFPPERCKLFTFLYVYGKNYVPDEKFANYLIEAYNLFCAEICEDGFISILEFATLVIGSGTDEIMSIIYEWGHDSDTVHYTRVPGTISETVYDFDYMCKLIDKALIN